MHPGHCNGCTSETQCLRKGGKEGWAAETMGRREKKHKEEKEKARTDFYRRTAGGRRIDERNGGRTQR